MNNQNIWKQNKQLFNQYAFNGRTLVLNVTSNLIINEIKKKKNTEKNEKELSTLNTYDLPLVLKSIKKKKKHENKILPKKFFPIRWFLIYNVKQKLS